MLSRWEIPRAQSRGGACTVPARRAGSTCQHRETPTLPEVCDGVRPAALSRIKKRKKTHAPSKTQTQLRFFCARVFSSQDLSERLKRFEIGRWPCTANPLHLSCFTTRLNQLTNQKHQKSFPLSSLPRLSYIRNQKMGATFPRESVRIISFSAKFSSFSADVPISL